MKIHYEKFKDLLKDIIGLPVLIVKVILFVTIAVFLGYACMSHKDVLQNIDMPVQEGNSKAPISEGVNGTVQSTGSPDATVGPEIAATSKDVKIVKNDSLTVFEIWNGKTKAGEIKREGPSQVAIWKEIGTSVYLGVNNDGLGGYILFGGPDEVYKLDSKKNSLDKIFDRDMFTSDISSDEKQLVSLESYYVRYDIFNFVNVYDLSTYQSESFQVPNKYKTAGNAFFSKDGKRVVYEAAVNNPDNEEYAMFVIDLATREQTQIGGNDSYGKAQEWAKNN